MATKHNIGFYTAFMLKQGLPERLDERIPEMLNYCFASVCYPGLDGELNGAYYILAADHITRERCLFTVWIDNRKNPGYLHLSTSDSFGQEDAEWDFYEPGTTLVKARQQVADDWQVGVA